MTASNNADGQSNAAIRTLPRVVEDLAQEYPNNTFMTLPLGPDLPEGWRSVTYRELNKAVHGIVGWIEATLGDCIEPGEVVAYIGITDMRYAIVETGLMKAGCSALLPSPRNSQSSQRSLFESSNCRLLLYSAGVDIYVDQLKSVLPEVQSFQIPAFDELCDWGSRIHPLRPYQEKGEGKQAIVLHTSGSTGRPKPIHHTYASINTVSALKSFAPAEGRCNITDAFLQSDASMLIVAPFFHIMGQTMLWRSLLCRAPLVITSTQKPPNAELIIKAVQELRPSLAFFPPSILEDITETPGGLDAMGLLDSVFFAGGPLATGAGEKLIHCTNLLNMLGSTETGICPSRVPLDKHDWPYFEIIPESGTIMKIDSSGLCEMVITKTHENQKYQGVFHTFPDIEEWRTRDLFDRHPEKENLWLYKGRKDDILVLSNGEKFSPVGFEKLVESHPMVKGALVVGQGRFQTGLLIEPDWTVISPAQDSSELLDLLWPTIEIANATGPAHSKLWRSKIIIANRDKPFKRAPKGSIIRSQTVDLFEAEIETLYSGLPTDHQLIQLPLYADIGTIKEFLRQVFKPKGREVSDSISDDQDIFSYGIDSLQVLELCHIVNRALCKDTRFTMSAKDVYSHPTVGGLATFVHNSINSDSLA
ncbi:Putative AMP-dependent synthetase/ligase, phosphopantetheine binding ACP domain, AMP-binding protein [Septoria linicola]|uniref:AMP-dependent synthetase/ligase, phosphopantetheine binding ACP domain, AMP-binding protein n=1 Tax=Septoria linicola TaxID=215465 RepID=A0A9Q9EQF9_9PEZI|nr:Putative AMP-dependent synthetase/ligase, phosphopantetheine binding ACP domain, AMP-binding protein [Septoria linicola]